MDINKILTTKKVMEIGLYFDGDEICYGGEYGQQVCRLSEDGVEEPITGIIYELYENSNLNYYCYYADGISNGQYICFYEDGHLKSVSNMFKGVRHGESYQWYEDGKRKSEGTYKYGLCNSLMKWDEQGNLIKEQKEPTEFDKELIEKYDKRENTK